MRKGQKISEETRKKISESKKKNYSDSGEDIKSKFRQSFTKEKRILAREKSKPSSRL